MLGSWFAGPEDETLGGTSLSLLDSSSEVIFDRELVGSAESGRDGPAASLPDAATTCRDEGVPPGAGDGSAEDA